MNTLPVTVHTPTLSRRSSVADLARFETVLDAADGAVAACMQSRVAAISPPPGDGTPAAELWESLHAVLGAVAAASHTSIQAPLPTASKSELVTWTLLSITNTRNEAVRVATEKNVVPGMDSNHVATCMELMMRLNQAMGGGVHGT